MNISNIALKTGAIGDFDSVKSSIGETLQRGNEFPHPASLLIPVKFNENKTGKVFLAGFILETLLNRCIRLADREPVCAI